MLLSFYVIVNAKCPYKVAITEIIFEFSEVKTGNLNGTVNIVKKIFMNFEIMNTLKFHVILHNFAEIKKKKMFLSLKFYVKFEIFLIIFYMLDMMYICT